MDRPLTRSQHPLRVQRSCERSRLEADLLTAAYELAVPVHRRTLPPPPSATTPAGRANRPTGPAKGVST